MDGLGLRENLPALVAQRFTSARNAGSLTFSTTELAGIQIGRDVPALARPSEFSCFRFQLRYCPALEKKPTSQSQPEAKDKSKPDPFLDPPSDLLIASIPQQQPRHILVLNKYPVITRHFILATKAVKPQTDLLEADDLACTYSCLKAWQGDASLAIGKLFAFFNSGEHSGASQPHRHVQFLPVEDMYTGQDQMGWEPLIDRMATSGKNDVERQPISSLPFLHFATSLPKEPSPDQLLQTYETLYKAAETSILELNRDYAPSFDRTPLGPAQAKISYNLAMTASAMAICPRLAEGGRLFDNEEDSMIDLNGTVLAGTLMVKTEREWNMLRENPQRLGKILRSIGIPIDRDNNYESPSYL